MKFVIATLALAFGTTAIAASSLTLELRRGFQQNVMLNSRVTESREVCTGSTDNQSCHDVPRTLYQTSAEVEVSVADSEINIDGLKVVVALVGEDPMVHSAEARRGRVNGPVFFEVEEQVTVLTRSARLRTLQIKLKLIPRLTAGAFDTLKMHNLKHEGGKLTFETKPEGDLAIATNLFLSKKVLIGYDDVWQGLLAFPAIETTPEGGKLLHTVHLRSLGVNLRRGKHKVQLWRSTARQNSANAGEAASLKIRL